MGKPHQTTTQSFQQPGLESTTRPWVEPLKRDHRLTVAGQRFGAEKIGPFLVGFGLWVTELMEQTGISTLVGLSREGPLLCEAISRLAASRGLSYRCSPLSTSRLALHTAQDIPLEDCIRVFFRQPYVTSNDVWRALSPDPIPPELNRTDPTPLRDNLEGQQRLLAIAKRHQRALSHHRQLRHASLMNSIHNHFDTDTSWVTVDLGFSGQMGRGLQQLLPQTTMIHTLAFADWGRDNHPPDHDIRPWLLPSSWRHTPAFVLRHLLEIPMSVPTGSVIGYDPQGEAICAPASGTPPALIDAIHRGALDYIDTWHNKTLEHPSTQWAFPLLQATVSPSAQDAELFRHMIHPIDFGSRVEIPVLHPDTPAAYRWHAGEQALGVEGHWIPHSRPCKSPSGIARLREQDIHRVGIYGFGRVGHDILDTLTKNGIVVSAVTDSHMDHCDHPHFLPPEKFFAQPMDAVIIGSHAFTKEIHRQLRQTFTDRGLSIPVLDAETIVS